MILTVILLVFVLSIIALAVELGMVAVARTQTQAAADASALAGASQLGLGEELVVATAQEYAGYNDVIGGVSAEVAPSDVEIGIWRRGVGNFEPNPFGNAVRVTAHATAKPYFFSRVLGKNSFDADATAIACAVPRDIIFVIDLSGSMNDDTEPAWSVDAINANTEATPGDGDLVMNQVYYDVTGTSGVGNEVNLKTMLENADYSVASKDYS